MQNARLDDLQAGNKTVGRNINNLKYAGDTTLVAESKEELKSLLMKMKEESEKTDLKLYIKKIKIMASSHITSWQIGGGKLEADFLFLGSKITVDGDWSHEIRRQLLLGRKAMKNIDIVFKSKDTTLPTKVHIVKVMVFPGVREDSWESLGQQGDETTQSKGNQSWIVIGSTDAEAEAPILCPPDVMSRLIGKDPDVGKIEGRRRRGWQRMRRLDGITD